MSLLSDLGSILGVAIGMSVVTAIEFIFIVFKAGTMLKWNDVKENQVVTSVVVA